MYRSPTGTNKSQFRNTVPVDTEPDDNTTFTEIAVNIEVSSQQIQSNRRKNVHSLLSSVSGSKVYFNFSHTQTLEIITNDFTFATSTEISSRQPYGKAKSCQWPPYTLDAAMSINLTQTPFRIAESVSLL